MVPQRHSKPSNGACQAREGLAELVVALVWLGVERNSSYIMCDCGSLQAPSDHGEIGQFVQGDVQSELGCDSGRRRPIACSHIAMLLERHRHCSSLLGAHVVALLMHRHAACMLSS